MSWTKSRMQDHIIDQMLKIVIGNKYNPNGYFYNETWMLDLSQHRRTVNDGYLKTGDNPEVDGKRKPIVIYQEDYQQIYPEIDEFVDGVTECFNTGTANAEGDILYTEPSTDWIQDGSWTINYGDFSCNASNGTDDFGNTIQGEVSQPTVANIYAGHNCTQTGVDTYFSLEINTPAIEPTAPTPVIDYLSQIIPLGFEQTIINPEQAEGVLDTTIYELLPGIQTRQERIDKFFSEYSALKAPQTPEFDGNQDTLVDPDWDLGGSDIHEGTASDEYSAEWDISNPANATTGYITRLVRHTEQSEANADPPKSLEWLRNDINLYLEDIDTFIDPDAIDDRPDYTDIAEGYLKFRGLNQSIIIRSEADTLLGLEDYISTGFTITMWVRFIDKKTGGTLFNYGNPFGNGSTYGFALETFSVAKDDFTDTTETTIFGDIYPALFTDKSHARFVRLVVNENGTLKDSHLGSNSVDRLHSNSGIPQVYQKTLGAVDSDNLDQAMTHTQIPIDRNEWYFIVANYNPSINDSDQAGTCTGGATDSDCSVDTTTALKNDPDYWRWNVNPNSTSQAEYTNFSGMGAKCKVEIISKSDLLRARGYLT